MSEVANFVGRKGAFLGSKFQFCLSEPLEDLSEAGQVLFPGGGKHYDVVKVE